MLYLRDVSPADVEILAGWFPDAASVRGWAGPGVDWPVDQAAFRSHRDDPSVRSWAAWCPPDAQRLAGYIELVRLSDDAGRLDRVVIAPELRGTRLGLPLVTAALQEARRIGLTTVDLLVFAGNEPALRTYTAAGFSDLGGLPDYPSVIRMSLDFQKPIQQLDT